MAERRALVGREAELQWWREQLRTGRPAGAVIVAAIGLGAHRLASEFARAAASGGFAVARISGHPGLRPVSFAALAPLIAGAGVAASLEGVLAAHRSLDKLASARGLALVVDAAHHLDDASAAVIAQAAADGLVVPIATTRSGEELPTALRELVLHGSMARIDLEPLAPGDVSAVVAAAVGGAVDGRVPVALRSAVGGNPLYLHLMVDAARSSGALVEHAGVWRLAHDPPLPPLLVELVEAELLPLDEARRRLCDTLAVAGPIPVSVLDGLGPQTRSALDALERSAIVTVTGDSTDAIAHLTDPAHTTVLRATTSVVRRRAIGARLLTASASEVGGVDDVRRVLWQVLAAQPCSTDDLVAAARRAYAAERLDEADVLARAALARGRRFDAELLLGEVLRERGRAEEADGVFGALRPDSGSAEERALAAMVLATNWFYNLGREQEAVALTAAVARELGDDPWGLEVLGLHAVFLVFSGHIDEGVAEVEHLLHGHAGRPFVEAVTAVGPAYTVMGRSEDAVAITDRAIPERVALGDQPILAPFGLHIVVRSFALLEAGRLADALELGGQIYNLSVTGANRDGQAWAALHLARVAVLQGRVRAALAWAREATSVFDEVGLRAQLRWAYGMILLAAAHAGDRASADYTSAALAGWTETYFGFMEPDVLRAQAWGHAVRGDLAGARDGLVLAARAAEETGQTGLEVAALHDLVRLGEPTGEAARLKAVAAPVQSLLARPRVEHQRALAARDVEGLVAVATDFENLGADLFAAEALMQAASQRRRAGEARPAASIHRRAMELLARCEGAATPATAGWSAADLTGREREVATLAAQGWASKRIASHLDVSARTVDNLLQRAYRKLGVTNRRELSDVLEG